MKQWRDIRITLGTALVLCVMAAATGAASCYAAFGWRTQAVQTKLREIDALVADKYVGELDAGLVADYAAVGYMTGVGDRWSSYISAEQYEAYALRNEGKTCGIGVSVVQAETYIRVNLVYDDSPAGRAGLEKGDDILAADGVSVKKDGTAAVMEAIRGEEGEPVTVTVCKAATGQTQKLTMTRAVVQQKMVWGEMLSGGAGYIRIDSFREGAAAQYQTVLDSLLERGAQKLVIDVRHNSGGRVKEMSAMLDPLLPEGTIMTLTTKDGQDTVYRSDAQMIEQPIAVLIDDQSFSAAEFFAAALQEYERATLIGVHTTGKGRAQRTYELSDGSAVNLSVEQYYTPKGNNLADKGIMPDETVELTDAQLADFYFLTEESDPQLQKALDILS